MILPQTDELLISARGISTVFLDYGLIKSFVWTSFTVGNFASMNCDEIVDRPTALVDLQINLS